MLTMVLLQSLLLAVMVLALAKRVTSLKQTVTEQGEAHSKLLATFCELTAALAAQADTLEAQGVVNERQLATVKLLRATLTLHDEAILRLRAQDCQFMDILVAVNLVSTQTPPLTVN